MNRAISENSDPKAWFVHDRFGAFLHWGIYSHSGKEASWGLQRGLQSYADYDRYQSVFEADLYDPFEWARQLRDAGIRYATLATKHHDGFSLWDTAYSDYKVTNTPAGPRHARALCRGIAQGRASRRVLLLAARLAS